MKLISKFAVVGLLVLTGSGVLNAQMRVRIGTVDRPSLVVAYYRSALWSDVMKAKLSEQAEAKKANDAQKVKELESWGQESQALTHRQVAGAAPIDNIIEALRPAFVEIAQKEKVQAIVTESVYLVNVETVDLTDQVLEWLKADANTIDMSRTWRTKPEVRNQLWMFILEDQPPQK